VFIPLQPGSATTLVTISTDKQVYEIGEEIIIQGRIAHYRNDSPVVITVIDPDGRLYQIGEIATNSGKYIHKFEIEDSNAPRGIYTVKAVKEGGLGEASFQIGPYLDQVDVVIQEGAANERSKKSFGPKVLSVIKGTTVVWTNKDIIGHSITSGVPDRADFGTLFDSGFPLISIGGTFRHKFDTSDTFPYFCSVHPWMMGKIIVGESSENPMIAINALTKVTDFNTGDIVRITGSVRPTFLQVPLSIEVHAPNKQSYVSDEVVVEQYGQFSYKFKLDKFAQHGTYNITLTILDSKKSLAINVKPSYEEPITISETELTNSEGSVSEINIGDQAVIHSKLASGSSTTQRYVYITQVKNSLDVTESFTWIRGKLTDGEITDVQQSWIPEEIGTYKIQVFVWEALNDPVPLAFDVPQMIIEVKDDFRY